MEEAIINDFIAQILIILDIKHVIQRVRVQTSRKIKGCDRKNLGKRQSIFKRARKNENKVYPKINKIC